MKRHEKIVLSVGLAVVCLWVGSGLFLYCFPGHVTFGDMFGAINVLFSGLAFVGVVFAIFLQHDELDQAKAEFARSAQAQKQAAELQALTLLFQEYKLLLEEKREEINRVIGNDLVISTGFYNTLLRERDVILERKYHIFRVLEKTAGIQSTDVQQSDQSDSSVSGNPAG